MDGSSPLLTLLCVCGICREMVYVQVQSGGELVDVEKVNSLGLFLTGMLNQHHLWRPGQWAAALSLHFLSIAFWVFP